MIGLPIGHSPIGGYVDRSIRLGGRDDSLWKQKKHRKKIKDDDIIILNIIKSFMENL